MLDHYIAEFTLGEPRAVSGYSVIAAFQETSPQRAVRSIK